MGQCGEPCEVYSRVVGYLRPVKQWNAGKKAEYSERQVFVEPGSAAVAWAQLASMVAGDLREEADWLRSNGHAIAGEILALLISQRESVLDDGPEDQG